ncbi:hypothetical protein Y1Q_0010645 [Alligator mississippiensis]|uniref:Uncharacterized protein n=1 Tax=Alligator mississippiensis TaxID=8496 RepID=A0A151M6B4_ALLMI|nr:hypothetical protein Y1Q_0010645 [Alligator mississippiensis]
MDCFDAPAELDAPAVTDTVEIQKILSSNQTEEASGKRKETSSFHFIDKEPRHRKIDDLSMVAQRIVTELRVGSGPG